MQPPISEQPPSSPLAPSSRRVGMSSIFSLARPPHVQTSHQTSRPYSSFSLVLSVKYKMQTFPIIIFPTIVLASALRKWSMIGKYL